MAAFKPIIVDLDYERDHTTEKLWGVDVSAHLLLVFTDEQSILKFEEEGPADFHEFGDLIQADPLLDAHHPYTLPGEFSFQAALEDATEGRYGDDLLDMWRGWKAEAEAENILEKRIDETARTAAERLGYDLRTNDLLKGNAGLRPFLQQIFAIPGAIELAVDEILNGDSAVLDRLKAAAKLGLGA